MYLEYFALKRHPFRITPDPSLFFHGGSRGRGVVLDALVYGITSGEGILKVTGEVGSGKTMLCRMLEERLPDSIEIVYLANPSLSPRDILHAIAIELKLSVEPGTDRLLVQQQLQAYLLRRHAEGGSVVVFIEEAQSMPLETLEEIRLLSNLETHRHKLLQIVLFGQPELDQKLALREIRQLRERITHSFSLSPLGLDEVREYLHFRLQAAGCPWPALFSPAAERLLARASGGLSRRINILADKALLAAYADPATRPDARNGAGERLPVVLPRHVRTAIADSAYRSLEPSRLRQRLGYGMAALAGALACALAVWLWQPALVATPVASPARESAAPAPAPPGAEPQAASALQPASEAGAGEATAPVPAAAPVAEPATIANVEAGAESAAAAVPSSTAEQSAGRAGLRGLVRERFLASAPWLATLPDKRGYAVQLYSAAAGDSESLEAFLALLLPYELLERSWLCRISGNSERQPQWLLLHGEFAGLSEARAFIDGLPPALVQRGPYARNIDGIACANDGI